MVYGDLASLAAANQLRTKPNQNLTPEEALQQAFEHAVAVCFGATRRGSRQLSREPTRRFHQSTAGERKTERPQDIAGKWCRLRDSNTRPHHYE
jgi:hypothetical protein